MNTMTAKALTRELFDARMWAGRFDGYGAEDMLEWTMDIMAELMDGDLTPEQVAEWIKLLED